MKTCKHILVVDDDEFFRETLANQIQIHEELMPVQAATASEALEKVKSTHFDVIILDIGLPDMDGREACRLLRRDRVTSPIIMLTGADSDADTILALDAGANDYVTKPFHIGILLARVRAQIRQHERSNDAVLTIGPFAFKPANRILLNNNSNIKIRLTDKETEILKFLYRANGRPIKRDVLLSEVWGYHKAAETHTLETYIYRLRQKIEHDPYNPQTLLAENGGYRLLR